MRGVVTARTVGNAGSTLYVIYDTRPLREQRGNG
jgi:hypothetical protein